MAKKLMTVILLCCLILTILAVACSNQEPGVHTEQNDSSVFDSVASVEKTTCAEAKPLTEANNYTTASEADPIYEVNLIQEREAVYTRRDLARAIEISPFIFTGTCIRAADKDRVYIVTVNKAFRGEIENEVLLRSPDYPLEVSKEYLFFTEIHGNVIIDRVYHVVKEIVDVKDGNLYSVAIQDIKDWTYDRLISELPRLVENNPSILPPDIVLDYIHSSDYEEIAEHSEYVADVRLIEISRVLADRMWCTFEIITMIKGELDQNVFIVVPLNSVEEGRSYRICFMGIDGSTNVCIISAPESIWPIEP